jgi:hypothetical protein
MESNRKPTLQEERILDLLVKKSTLILSDDWKDELLVCPMDDGEMGSLYLFPKGIITKDRIIGVQVSDFQFTDSDGIEVIASLNLDENGNLFELDLWKTDFSKLIKLLDI